MQACIREFVEKKELSLDFVFLKYKQFAVKKSSEEVKTIRFSIITDFFLAFPSLFFIGLSWFLFVCLDERYQMSPGLESLKQYLYSFIETFIQLFFLCLLESRLRCYCCCSFCCW